MMYCKECDTQKNKEDFVTVQFDTLGNELKHSFCKECYYSKKICQICKKEKNIFEFSKNQRSISGKVLRRPSCKDCRKKKVSLSQKDKKEYIKKNPPPKIGESFNCPICHKNILIQKIGDVNLDHSHINGEIRGWLCRKCNTALGTFDDNPTILRRAIDWVLRRLSIFF